MGLVILGVHAPEFEFEKLRDNVVTAVQAHGLKYAIAQDNDLQTWRAFNNQFWPAKYLIDKDGFIRYTHFGEGAYAETELKIRQVLGETGSDLRKVLASNEPELELDERAHSSTDPLANQTRELYAGFLRNYGALQAGSQPPYVRHEEFYAAPDREFVYMDPGDHLNHFLYLHGPWRNGMNRHFPYQTRVSKEPTILEFDDCTDAPERCQTRYRAYWTTFWCGGWWSIGWESHLRYTMAPFQPLQTRTSPLVTPHHLR